MMLLRRLGYLTLSLLSVSVRGFANNARRICMIALALSGVNIIASDAAHAQPSWLPVQVEIRTPFEPTAVPIGQRTSFFYELHLTNFKTYPLLLKNIEVLDADAPTAHPLAVFEAADLPGIIKVVGRTAPPPSKGYYEIP